MERWIKIHSQLLEWEWHDDPNMISLWIHLLALANHKDKKWHGQVIQRGQLVTGRKELSVITGISERSIRTCLSRLIDTGEIITKSTNKFTVITICNYEKYQLKEDTCRPTNDQQPASIRPATGQQQTTTQEYKEYEKEKIIINNNSKEKNLTLGVDIPEDLREPIMEWLKFKQQSNHRYTSQIGIKRMIATLRNYSGGDAEKAMQIVHYSEANNYQGLFEPKQNAKKSTGYIETNRKIEGW